MGIAEALMLFVRKIMIKKSKTFTLPLCLHPTEKSNLSWEKSVTDPVLGIHKPQRPGEKSVTVETLSISLQEGQRGDFS